MGLGFRVLGLRLPLGFGVPDFSTVVLEGTIMK